jgi:hypothetical protein
MRFLKEKLGREDGFRFASGEGDAGLADTAAYVRQI